MERPAARRHFPGKGPAGRRGRKAGRSSLEDRQPGTRLVVADHRRRPPVHHRRRGRRPGHLRLRPRRQAAVEGQERPLVDRLLPGSKGLLRLLPRQALPYQRPRPRGLPGGRDGQGAVGRRRAGAFPGAEHHLGHERMPAGRRPPGACDAGRREGPDGRAGQAERPNGLDHAAAGRRPGLARLAAAVPPCRQADRGQLLVGPRLRRRCRQRKLLWSVPLRSPYGVNVATPVYGAGRSSTRRPTSMGPVTLRPGEAGPQPEKAWSTTLDTCTGTVLLVDGLLYGSGYKKHKSWLCLDWKSGRSATS